MYADAELNAMIKIPLFVIRAFNSASANMIAPPALCCTTASAHHIGAADRMPDEPGSDLGQASTQEQLSIIYRHAR